MRDDDEGTLTILPDPSAPETRLAKGATIVGATGTVSDLARLRTTLRELNGRTGVFVVLLRADRVLEDLHLREAIRRAARYHEQEAAAPTTLAADVLRYVAGSRQIERAIAMVGVRAGPCDALLAVAGPIEVEAVLSALGLTRMRARFGEPLEVLGGLGLSAGARPPIDLLLEAMALLELELPRAGSENP